MIKRFVKALTPRDITKYLILLILLIIGIAIGRFWGGFLAGATSICLLVAVIGKAIFTSTVSRIDKQIKDHLTNQ